MEQFLHIYKTFALVKQQDRHLQMTTPMVAEIENEEKTLAVANNASFSKGGNYINYGHGRIGCGQGRGQCMTCLCTHRGKINHTIDSCYFLLGFPSGYQTKNNKSGSSANSAGREVEPTPKIEASNAPLSLTQDQYK